MATKRNVSVAMPIETYKELKARAEETGIPVSVQVRDAAIASLEDASEEIDLDDVIDFLKERYTNIIDGQTLGQRIAVTLRREFCD